MRKLLVPCLLVISLMTASAAQLSVNTLNDSIDKEGAKHPVVTYIEVIEEEEDEVFDFNVKEYLPIGFDANRFLEFEMVLEEEDAPFDFDTKDYLPIGFGLKQSIIDSIEEIRIEEEDTPFDFDTKKYLPIGFNPSKKAISKTEI